MVRVLVIGPTPPPYLGAQIMLESLVRSHLRGVELHHLTIRLSNDHGLVGKFRWTKLIRMLFVIIRIIWMRVVFRSQIVYYVPELMTPRTTVLRDAVILLATRHFFPRVILHFQCGGYVELDEEVPRWQRWLMSAAYFGTDAAIRTSELNPDLGKRFAAKRNYVIPNGIDDPCPEFIREPLHAARSTDNPLKILFVGNLRESKGVFVLLHACAKLAALKVPFQLEIMGPWSDEGFAARTRQLIKELNLSADVRFLGVLLGEEKFAAFRRSDVLCFPTFFEGESFGVVLIEAMACGLPVVSTVWRGIPSVVDDGKTGFLVRPHDPEALADRLAFLAQDAAERAKMGDAGRERFLREFTLSRHLERMRIVFLDVAGVSRREEELAVAEPIVLTSM